MDMTEEFEKRDSFIHWFLIAALAGTKISEKVAKKPRIVTMQLNGVEIDPMKALTRLEEEFNRLVLKKAKEISNEAMFELIEPFEEKMKDLTDKVHELIEKNF